jgi:hypothetical protein
MQGFAHAFGIAGNDRQIGAGRLVGLAAALFLVSQGAERDVIARGEFFLRERQRTPQRLDAGHRRIVNRQGKGDRTHTKIFSVT